MTRPKWIVLLVGLALIVGGGTLLWRVKAGQRLGQPGLRVEAAATGSGWVVALPVRVRQYTSTDLGPTADEVAMLPKDTTFGRRLYRAPTGHEILLSAVMMGTDRTSIHKPEFCLENQGWRIVGRETLQVPIPGAPGYDLPVRRFTANELVKAPDGTQQRRSGVYVFWFLTDRRLTASHWQRMLYLTWDLLQTRELPRWSYVSCFSTCLPGEEEATYDRIQQFIRSAAPEFQVLQRPETVRGRSASRWHPRESACPPKA